MTRRAWSNVPYLDGLRPDAGWVTDIAVLATYSADLVAVVAALLALAGADDERGSGSKVDFVRAFDELRGRAFVLAQAGRVVAPGKSPKVLNLLDRFVRTVAFDEAERSWHPKVSLVRQRSNSGSEVQWRLWLGSRNLSRDTSWDVALTLVGRAGTAGAVVSGVAELAAELLSQTDLSAAQQASLVREVRGLHWEMPSGCQVDEVRLLRDGERGLPPPPAGIKRLIVVSPFLDGTTVGALGRWGGADTHRTLVSTQRELSGLAGQAGRPLHAYAEVLQLDAPDLEARTEDDASADGSSASEDEEPEQRGLHAKLLYVEHSNGRTLWFGSANATARGWRGPNVEAIARANVSAEVGGGLDAFLSSMGRIVNLDALPPHEEDEDERQIEEARRQVVTRWVVVARVREDALALEAAQSPHPDHGSARLEVALLGRPFIEWPRDQPVVALGAVIRAELTELVQCRLTLGERVVQWVQRTTLDPPPDEERDRQAIARYLDPRTFLLWIRSLLAVDTLGDGGGDWNAAPPPRSARSSEDGPVWWAPTLEEVLRAWARDPRSVVEVDRKVRRYLELVGTNPEVGLTEQERKVLDEFRCTWAVLRAQLVTDRR